MELEKARSVIPSLEIDKSTSNQQESEAYSVGTCFGCAKASSLVMSSNSLLVAAIASI